MSKNASVDTGNVSWVPQQSTTGDLARKQIAEWNRLYAPHSGIYDFSPMAKLSPQSVDVIRQIVREEVRQALHDALCLTCREDEPKEEA